MKTARYNKSEIMKEAWSMYRCTFFHYTFSQALQVAWRNAKEEAVRKEIRDRRMAEDRKKAEELAAKSGKNEFYNKFDKENARIYRNGTTGTSAWYASYGKKTYGSKFMSHRI